MNELNGHAQYFAKLIEPTPVVLLENICPSKNLFAKLEWYNPSNSIKYRPALYMLKKAEEGGKLKKGETIIIEPTSGNTGIALATLAKERGYKVEIPLSIKVSSGIKETLKKLGATIYDVYDNLCPKVGPGTDQSIAFAKAVKKKNKELYFMPDQYTNEYNFLAHYETTGPEIWKQTQGKITKFFAGIGTGGTITGVGKYLKEKNKDIKIYAVEPEKNHNISGLRNLEESMKPEILEKRDYLIDEWIKVSDKESFDMVREIFEKEELFVGPSSGAVLSATLENMDENDLVLSIFGDSGNNYRSTYIDENIFTLNEIEGIK